VIPVDAHHLTPDAIGAGGDRFSLDGRRVLVTGAGRGLGQGIALAAAEAGASVVGVARSGEQLAETARLAADATGSFATVPADLSGVPELDALVSRLDALGPFHGVVHAAGRQLRAPSNSVRYDEWRSIISLHLDVPFFLSMALLDRQRDLGISASHVFIGSLGCTIGIPRIAPYCAAKSGLLGLARTLAVEFAADGVRFNVLSPGYAHTQLTDDLLSDPVQRERVLGRIPAGRLGLPDEIGDAAVFLLSDASRYITGQMLNVDGGWLAG
jgi:2-deoxy-D-gluconate 3-dehydrogenase